MFINISFHFISAFISLDVDCGGGICAACVIGRSCLVDTDCVTYCVAGVCTASTTTTTTTSTSTTTTTSTTSTTTTRTTSTTTIFPTFTFTAGPATGQNGPTSAQMAALPAYTSQPWYSTGFSVSGGIQYFTCMVSGTYQVTAAGAAGGGDLIPNAGGFGIIIQTQVVLTKNSIYKILIGQMG